MVVLNGNFNQGNQNYENSLYREVENLESNFKSNFKSILEKIAENERRVKKAERLAAIGQTTSMIAHDVRRPFGLIKMFLSSFQKGHTDAEFINDSIASINSSLRQVDDLLNNVMEFTKPRKITPQCFSIDDFLGECIRETELFFKSRKKCLHVRFLLENVSPVQTVGDRAQLKRVFMNLISNAIEAMNFRGEIEIRSSVQSGYLSVSFLNSGALIDPDIAPRIFEPFFTHGKHKGTGLGLAICRQIVEAHKGTVRLDTSEGRTCFKVLLPITVSYGASASARVTADGTSGVNRLSRVYSDGCDESRAMMLALSDPA